jgi:hypothetical protein
MADGHNQVAFYAACSLAGRGLRVLAVGAADGLSGLAVEYN